MYKYLISAIALAFSVGVAFAAPTATISRLQQRYPWNGLVDITYTISGCDPLRVNEPHFNAVVTLNNADGTTSRVMKEIILTDFVDSEGVKHWNPPEQDGTYSVVWDSTEDFPNTISPNCMVYITFEPNTPSTVPADATGAANGIIGDLMVVDVSGGATVTNYPLEYYRSVDIGRFNCDVYKTDKIVLRRLRAGAFVMGSPSNESGRYARYWMQGETQHVVKFSRPSYIGIFELTQKQYKNITGSNPSYYSSYSDSDMFPLESLSYQGVRGKTLGSDISRLGSSAIIGAVDEDSLMGVLRARTGVKGFDIATASQWEYACRAGTATATYAGANNSSILNKICWYSGNASCPNVVGSKEPNAWGLYDMFGNVWEMTRDRITECTSAGMNDWGPSMRYDPIWVDGTNMYGSRGGHFGDAYTAIRSACSLGGRLIGEPEQWVGFRLSVTMQ